MTRIFNFIVCLAIAGSTHAQTAYKPYSGKVQSIQLNTGVNLQFVEQGNAKGIPVIMLHGYTDSWHSFETTLPFLPDNLHVFAISQRGHGDSERPKSKYHPKDMAADVAAFIRQKNLGPTVIVGHSLGGVIAQQFVLDHPQLTKAVVIAGSDVAFGDNPGLPEFIAEINKLSDPVSVEFADGFQKSTEFRPVDPAFHSVAVAETLKVPAHVWKSIAEGFMSVNYANDLSKINRSTLIVWGDKDAICPLADQQKMAAGIKNSKLLIYEETGHAVHWELPQRFAKDLTDFIRDKVAVQPQAK
jgi:non-heme chloroperoxidase